MKKPSMKPAPKKLKPAAPKGKPVMPVDPDGDNDMPMMKKGGMVKRGKKC